MENQWYHPLAADELRPAPGVPEPRAGAATRRARSGLIAVLSVFLALSLIAATSILFGARSVQRAASGGNAGRAESGDFASDFREFFSEYYKAMEQPEECTIPRFTPPRPVTVSLRPAGEGALSLREIYDKCVPSVVAITAFVDKDSDDHYYWGSGVVLTPDGYILTNSHVVQGSCRAKVTLWDDREFDALLVGHDPRSDVAVLKINARGLAAAEFCDIAALSVGDGVVAIGNPLGKEFRSTMTEGIISGIGRDVTHNGATLTLLQTSAPINEGNSGGPLINFFGQVIGITNMKMSASYAGSVSIEGVGFAIPSTTAKEIADSLLAYGEVRGRPALGITVGPVPDDAQKEYDLPEGLYVSAVSEGSDCEAKGIRVGDILTAVNGEALHSLELLTEHIQALQVGDTLTLTVWRAEKDKEPTSFDVTVKLMDVNQVY